MKAKILIAGSARSTHIQEYMASVERAGGEAVFTGACCGIDEYDGLLIMGGVDVDPSRYGEAGNGTESAENELDAWELALLDAFVQAKKPVFGICRGCQLINVYFGGTLWQNIPMQAHHRQAGGDAVHPVEAAGHSLMAALYGKKFTVNSAHHQAVKKVAWNMNVTLWSDDGVCEAIEHKYGDPVFGVQFHPERSGAVYDGSKLFDYFVQLCEKSTQSRLSASL